MSALLSTPVLVCAGALVLLALLVRGLLLGYPPPRLPTRFLSAKEQAIVAACADALFPPGGPIPLSGTEAGLVQYMEQYVARAPRSMRPLIRLLFHSVEHAPWIMGPPRPRFTRLRHDQQVAVLADMAKSRLYFRRVTFLSLRTILSMGYLANPEVARLIGMTPCAAPFERPKARPSSPGVVAAPVAAAAQASPASAVLGREVPA